MSIENAPYIRRKLPEELHDQFVYISEKQIKQRLSVLADELVHDFQDKPPFILALANGSYIFMADFTRALYAKGMDCPIQFMIAKSYGDATISSGVVNLYPMLNQLEIPYDNSILVVDDIADTGLTMTCVDRELNNHGYSDVKNLAFLRKPTSVRKVDFEPDYVGFNIDNYWVEGYGLDSGGMGRGRSNVVVRDMRDSDPLTQETHVAA